ncbi:MAG TPA: glycoside hydrolase family 15 protein, partial [Patescibacteria group bacterium]
MARSLVIGNGHLTVLMDAEGVVRDIYYPYVGLENHVGGAKHRIGLWWDGNFSWLDGNDWNIKISYENQSMLGQVEYTHKQQGIRVIVRAVVYNELPVFVRSVTFYNTNKLTKKIKIFFGQEFAISETKFRNTGFFDPTKNAIIHYKGRRVFLINGSSPNGGIDDYTVGIFNYEGKDGSYRDAEDGILTRNAVEHGPVDSVVAFSVNCEGLSSVDVFCWLCAAKSMEEAYGLNETILQKSAHGVMHSTTAFWQAWAEAKQINFHGLPENIVKAYFDSLFVLRAHLDHKGGIVASLDSDMLLYGKDSYTYVWPRDASFVAIALDKAGYSTITKKFYDFCFEVLHEDGYLHHRFQPDLSLGSTWQSSIIQKDWLKNKILQLPIQEDETATVIYGLWQHYKNSNDIEFIEAMYKPFIEKAVDFMLEFRDKYTGLPIQSYDLWEEVSGVSTYTCAAVCGALQAASRFATILGKYNHAHSYTLAVTDLIKAMRSYLFDPELNSFVRGLRVDGISVKKLKTIDSSALFGLWYYEVLDRSDPMFIGTQKAVEDKLHNKKGIGGFIRYENDQYYKVPGVDQSNPWIVTTLWDLQRRIKFSENKEELVTLSGELNWVTDRLSFLPVMAEQFHPYTGEPLSAAPLAWSHSVFVETVLMYLEKME